MTSSVSALRSTRCCLKPDEMKSPFPSAVGSNPEERVESFGLAGLMGRGAVLGTVPACRSHSTISSAVEAGRRGPDSLSANCHGVEFVNFRLFGFFPPSSTLQVLRTLEVLK